MDDLIYRLAAMESVRKLQSYKLFEGDDMVLVDRDEVQKELKGLPSAERKKGHWIIKDNPGTGWYRVTCSECGEDETSIIPMIGFFPNANPLWDFCPDCGARMERREE